MSAFKKKSTSQNRLLSLEVFFLTDVKKSQCMNLEMEANIELK